MEVRVVNVESGDGVIRGDIIVTEDSGDYQFLTTFINGTDVSVHIPDDYQTLICKGQISDPGITIPEFAYEVGKMLDRAWSTF